MTTLPTTNDLLTRAAVLVRLDEYLSILNDLALKPERYSFIAEPSGKNYRVIMVTPGQRSVHSFVDGNTGDILKSAGWKVPAKGVRYNLMTEMALVRNVADWAGSYLYTDQVKANHK